MIQSAIEVVGKTGQVTITAVGNASVHVHAGLLIGYQRRVQGAIFGGCNRSMTPRLLGLYRSGDLKLDELITRRYRLDEVNQGLPGHARRQEHPRRDHPRALNRSNDMTIAPADPRLGGLVTRTPT